MGAFHIKETISLSFFCQTLKNYLKDVEDSYIFKILNRYIMTNSIKKENLIIEN